ncbi:unnamed protein product [Plutella xylostella]|uniref:Diacylglycerol kinase n=1 Tax=Plutella xylostella TaxID=51655 RepID=A0A8S4G1P6_PLUXY|nr:unnamed protein product [Plutella xylostella]
MDQLSNMVDSLFHLNDVIFNYYFIIGGTFLSYLTYKIFHSLLSGNPFMKTTYKTRGHTWRSIQCNKSIPYSIYCTICGKLMLPVVGLFCECCAISACKDCHHAIDKKYKCKSVSWPVDKVFYHHWVNVGVARNEITDLSEECLKRYFCCWCQRTKLCHDSAFNDAEPCDFQKYRKIIIPPPCVTVEKGVVTVKPLPDPDWEPLIIFANRKSGGNQSDEVLSLFRGLLNPIQVVDMNATSPESVVRWLPARARALAAGGDGTVAWLLQALSARPTITVPVGILPTGTGNDLSRALGWGAGCGCDLSAHATIQRVLSASTQLVDRWKISIFSRGRLGGLARAPRVLYAHNYCSVGVDAQVALDFHRARAQLLYRCASRTINYRGCGRAGRARLPPGEGTAVVPVRLKDHQLCECNVRWDEFGFSRVLYAHNYCSVGVDAQVALDFHRATQHSCCTGIRPGLSTIVGVDAQVALNFHRERAQLLYRCASRTVSYIAYGLLGATRAFDDGGCEGLERRLSVRLDGREPLPLPPLQALVLLNIPSWGAGVDLWSMGDENEVGEQSISDGKLEVVGISSSIHIARLQCGLAEPYRFAQASRVTMELSGSIAMQVDGEPWMQGAARISVEPAGQSLLLKPASSEI